MKFTSVPFAFQSKKGPRQFNKNEICAVVVGHGPISSKPRRFVNVLIPSVLSSVADDDTLALNRDIKHICENCHFCVYYDMMIHGDKAVTNLSMGVWFLGENGELDPYTAEPFTAESYWAPMLSPKRKTFPDELRGFNFYHRSKEDLKNNQGMKLEECVELMTEKKKVALVWSMIGTTESEIVSWNTLVIINPLFCKTLDCPMKDSLVGMIANLLKPVLDLNEKRPCEVEVAIVHDTDESSKALNTYLKANLEKRIYNPDISFSQIREFMLEGKDFIGSANTKKLLIDLELVMFKKAYKLLATEMGEYEDFKTIVELDKVDNKATLIKLMVMFITFVGEKKAAASE
jgi:hypothetical protein